MRLKDPEFQPPRFAQYLEAVEEHSNKRKERPLSSSRTSWPPIQKFGGPKSGRLSHPSRVLTEFFWFETAPNARRLTRNDPKEVVFGHQQAPHVFLGLASPCGPGGLAPEGVRQNFETSNQIEGLSVILWERANLT